MAAAGVCICTMACKIYLALCVAQRVESCVTSITVELFYYFCPIHDARTHIEMGHTPKTHIQYIERYASVRSLLLCFFQFFFVSFHWHHSLSLCTSVSVIVSFCRLKLSFHSVHHYPQLVFKADAAGAAINDRIVQIRFVKSPLNANISDTVREREKEQLELNCFTSIQ